MNILQHSLIASGNSISRYFSGRNIKVWSMNSDEAVQLACETSSNYEDTRTEALRILINDHRALFLSYDPSNRHRSIDIDLLPLNAPDFG